MLQLLAFMNLTGSIFFLLHMIFVPFEKKFMPPQYRVYIYRLNLMCFIIPFPVCLFYIRRYFDTIVTELPVIPFAYNGAHIIVQLKKNLSFALPRLNYFQMMFLLLWIAVVVRRYKRFLAEKRKLRDFNSSHILFQKDEKDQNAITTIKLVQIAQKELKLKKRPRIILQKGVIIPHVSGIFRPTLCLPCYWNVSEQVYYMTIKHELSHVRHKDLLFQRIALITGIINWFNPIFFIMCKKMANCEELAADACACNNVSKDDRNAYQSAILDLSFNQQFNSSYSSVKGFGLRLKHKNFIKERILTMKNKNLNKHKFAKLIAATLMSVIIFLLSAIPALAYNLPSTLESENETVFAAPVDMIIVDKLPIKNNPSPAQISLIPEKNDIDVPIEDLDFSQSDYLCIDINGVIYDITIEPSILSCDHDYSTVQIMHHIKDNDGQCTTTRNNGNQCTKCNYIEILDEISILKYKKCPHDTTK